MKILDQIDKKNVELIIPIKAATKNLLCFFIFSFQVQVHFGQSSHLDF